MSYVCVCVCVCTQLHWTLCHPMDCSLTGSSVYGIFLTKKSVGYHFLLHILHTHHLMFMVRDTKRYKKSASN